MTSPVDIINNCVVSLQNEAEAAKAANETLKLQVHQLKVFLDKDSTVIKNLEDANTDLKKQLQKSVKTAEALETETEKLRQENVGLTESLALSNTHAAAIERDNDWINSQLADRERQLADKEQQLASLRSQLTSLEDFVFKESYTELDGADEEVQEFYKQLFEDKLTPDLPHYHYAMRRLTTYMRLIININITVNEETEAMRKERTELLRQNSMLRNKLSDSKLENSRLLMLSNNLDHELRTRWNDQRKRRPSESCGEAQRREEIRNGKRPRLIQDDDD